MTLVHRAGIALPYCVCCESEIIAQFATEADALLFIAAARRVRIAGAA